MLIFSIAVRNKRSNDSTTKVFVRYETTYVTDEDLLGRSVLLFIPHRKVHYCSNSLATAVCPSTSSITYICINMNCRPSPLEGLSDACSSVWCSLLEWGCADRRQLVHGLAHISFFTCNLSKTCQSVRGAASAELAELHDWL